MGRALVVVVPCGLGVIYEEGTEGRRKLGEIFPFFIRTKLIIRSLKHCLCICCSPTFLNRKVKF